VQISLISCIAEEEFLLVFDAEQKYGDAWLLVCSVEAKDEQLADLRAKLEVGLFKNRKLRFTINKFSNFRLICYFYFFNALFATARLKKRKGGRRKRRRL
jgi:hypothetical protein